MRIIFMIWTRNCIWRQKLDSRIVLTSCWQPLPPTPNWCVTSETSVLDIHDVRAYLCHYSSLTGPRFISCEIVTSAVVTVRSVGIAHGIRSRRCYHHLANLVITSQTLIFVVQRIINPFCVVNYTVFAADGSNFQVWYKCDRASYIRISKEDVPTWCKQFYYDFFS